MSSTVTADELDYVEIDRPLVELAVKALDSAERRELRVVTAESCTGGLIATVLSEAPGAADYFDGAFVCYTADHKCAALGLDPGLIERCGVVSKQVATAMANGASGAMAGRSTRSLASSAAHWPTTRAIRLPLSVICHLSSTWRLPFLMRATGFARQRASGLGQGRLRRRRGLLRAVPQGESAKRQDGIRPVAGGDDLPAGPQTV